MNLYDINILKSSGDLVSLSNYKDKVILVVNTATKCGFTPQYEDLKNLHNKYAEKGLVILDFPCNQFGEQAPGTNEEIHEFCSLNFNTPYEQFAKIDVNGENETDLYKFLKSQKGFGGFNNEGHSLTKILHEMMLKADANYASKPSIKWNFTKFLINKDGVVVDRFEPVDSIEDLEKEIKSLLN